MRYEIPVRIIVENPLSGVVMQVQRGRDELLPPAKLAGGTLIFEFVIDCDLSGEKPNFLGSYAQGPKDARFIYVNSGSYAGQQGTCWDRRAKLSLMTVTKDEIDRIVSDPKTLLETSFSGIGRDGGPTCASVKGIRWKVAKR